MPSWEGIHRLAQPTIGKKFALFFALLLAIALGSGLVIDRALTRLGGTASQINLTGSLRWQTRELQVEVRRYADATVRDRSPIDEGLQRVEGTLQALKQGGAAASVTIPPLAPEFGAELAELEANWARYRNRTAQLLAATERGENVEAEWPGLREDGMRVVRAADALTRVLATQVERLQQDLRRTLRHLALANGVILLAGLLAIRLRIVRPLKRLAEASQRIAGGRYDLRLRQRSNDEIGQLASAFDTMAHRVEQHVGQMAEDNRRLRQAHEKLNQLLHAVEHSPATVIVTDRNGIIEYVNPKFTETTGYSAAEALGQRASMLKSGRMPQSVYTEMWQALGAGREWRGQLLNRKRDGGVFWEDTWISPVRNEAGETTHYIAVKEDVTEKRLLEQNRARMNELLESRVAQRTAQLAAMNKELESFSYSVSHDLRAPLRAIHGFAHVMAETCAGCANGDSLDYLARIQRASVRMGDIIDDLLALSQVSRHELRCERVDLSGLAHSVLVELQSAEPGRCVAATIDEDMFVAGDPNLLRIALDNLIGNAWKFTAGRDSAQISVTASRRDSDTMVCVGDNGAGFDMAYAEKLFVPFERLHRADEFGGSGIGLATVKRIVQLHGGRIWAEARVGQGATFCFTLPIREARTDAPAAA